MLKLYISFLPKELEQFALNRLQMSNSIELSSVIQILWMILKQGYLGENVTNAYRNEYCTGEALFFSRC